MEQLQLKGRNRKSVHDVLKLFRDKIVHDVLEPDTYPQELEALLHYNGFQIIEQYGNWEKEPLSSSSPSIISVCKA